MQVPPWWEGVAAGHEANAPYPMDYYAKDGGVWNSSYHKGAKQQRGGAKAGAAAGGNGPLVLPHLHSGPAVGREPVAL